jgi:hypothetical protein
MHWNEGIFLTSWLVLSYQLKGVELSTQGCSRISVSEKSMVPRGGQTYFALWKIVGNYLLGKKIWNHFASSQFLLLHLHKISPKKTPISHMQISLFYRFMVLLPYSRCKTSLYPVWRNENCSRPYCHGGTHVEAGCILYGENENCGWPYCHGGMLQPQPATLADAVHLVFG